MIGLLESLARPVLRMLDPEDAHRIAIRALKLPPFAKLVADDPRLAVRAFRPGCTRTRFTRYAERLRPPRPRNCPAIS